MHTPLSKLAALAVLCAAAAAAAPAFAQAPAQAQAQDYPRRPISFVVGNAPGITTDILARTVAAKLTERLGWTVVIENRPGANLGLAYNQVLRAPADGYTVLVPVSSLALLPFTSKSWQYDFLKEFVPLSRMANARLLMLATPSMPFNDIRGLVAYAKANPGKLSFASANAGSITHLGGELLKQVAGIDMVNIPYKSSAFNLDVASGTVPVGVNTVSTTAQLVKSGKVKALAVLSQTRDPALPDVPSTAELGLPEVEADAWFGLAVRVGTPAPIVARLSREIMAALNSPDVREKILAMGASPVSETPESFANRFAADLKQWAAVVKSANVKMED